MKEFIIVYFDNINNVFNNDEYENISKAEAIKAFRTLHDASDVIINIIEI